MIIFETVVHSSKLLLAGIRELSTGEARDHRDQTQNEKASRVFILLVSLCNH